MHGSMQYLRKDNMTKILKIYTDGSSLGNPGPGGFSIVLVDEDDLVSGQYFGCEPKATNQRMELMAVVTALSWVQSRNVTIMIYTDSGYVRNSIVKGWYKNWIMSNQVDRPNFSLWRDMYDIMVDLTARNCRVEIHQVKGHSDDEFNNLADKLAVNAAKTQTSNFTQDES